ncbi:S41 family peptidase [candidate division KSB1 bacterium]|nr:S41 family peptidase [candidate division KSB1 bacterium]
MEISRQNKFRMLVTAFLVLITLLVWLIARYRFKQNEVNRGLQKLFLVLRVVQDYYVEDVKLKDLVDTGIQEILTDLNQPGDDGYAESDLISRLTRAHDSAAVGLHLTGFEKFPLVIAAYPFSPAAEAGIQPGDIVLRINEKSTYRLPIQAVNHLLLGPVNTPVKLKLLMGDSSRIHELQLVRKSFPVMPILAAFMLDPTTGFIRIGHLGPDCVDSLRIKLQTLQNRGMRQLVLDLRSNSLGQMAQARQVLELFTPKGSRLFRIVDRQREKSQEFEDADTTPYETLPLILLIDHGTAQWAEAIAGTLQDLDRALILGESSYGLANVRTTYQLKAGGSIQLITGRYYTPSGRSPGRKFDTPFYRNFWTELDSLAPDSIRLDNGRFTTANGRPVYAAEGITPDQFVPADIPAEVLAQLAQKQLLEQFVSMQLKPGAFTPMNFQHLARQNFTVDGTLARFNRFVRQNQIQLTPQQYQQLESSLNRKLKTAIAAAKWGRHQAVIIDSQEDPLVQTARAAFERWPAWLPWPTTNSK